METWYHHRLDRDDTHYVYDNETGLMWCVRGKPGNEVDRRVIDDVTVKQLLDAGYKVVDVPSPFGEGF